MMTSAELAALIVRHFGPGTPFTAEDFQARTGRELGVGDMEPATLTLLSSEALVHYPPAGRRRRDRGRRAVAGAGYYVLRRG